MPFDLAGNFTRVQNWQQDRDNGIRILADRHDAEDNNFATAFNQVFLRNGVVPMTGPLNMNGKKITTIAAGTEAAPGLTFELSSSTGLWQANPNHIGISINGVKQLEVNSLNIYATPYWTIGKHPGGLGGLLNGTGDFSSISMTPTAWGAGFVQIGAGYTKDAAGVGNYALIHASGAGKGIALTVSGVNIVEVAAAGTTLTGANLSKGSSVLRVENTGAGGVPAGSVGVGHEFFVSGGQAYITSYNRTAGTSAPMQFGATFYGFNAPADGTKGVVDIFATPDPGVTPAILHVRTSGVGGGAAVPQYVARFDGSLGSYNGASSMTGVWAKAFQNIGGANYGVWGEVGNGQGINQGIHGKSSYHSDIGHGLAVACGVYGEIAEYAGAGNTAFSSAGTFEHKGTKGNTVCGVYSNVQNAGATNINLFMGAFSGVTKFTVNHLGLVTPNGGMTIPADQSSQIILNRYSAGNPHAFFTFGQAGNDMQFNQQAVGPSCYFDNAGIYPVTATTASAANIFQSTSLAALVRSTSALRYKRDVAPVPLPIAHKLLDVRPIQFKSRSEVDDPDKWFYGFVAEEVAKAGLDPLIHYAFQEDQYDKVPYGKDEPNPSELPHKTVLKKGAKPRPDGVQYERVVVLQQLLINELFERLEALEGKL